ncbi:MAG: hypothetical protein SF187_12435 [Deltaproteobacteria bacterium]|nr:hypothetical protein [Deltaproteobacteria bacterium]
MNCGVYGGQIAKAQCGRKQVPAPARLAKLSAVALLIATSMTGTQAQAADPEPKVAEIAVKKEAPPAKPTLTVGLGMRTGLALSFNNPQDKTLISLNDGLVDQANIRPFMTGQLNPTLGFFGSFELGTAKGLGQFAILDAIMQLKFREEFQIWVGQHIGANDRNNMNGPFFGNGWNFAIGVPSYPFDTGARDRGFTIWGLIKGGRLKYHASMLDLQPGQTLKNARYGGRLVLHLLEPEAFYYNSGTYFGQKDVLAIGATINYQKGVETAMPLENDFLGYSFDVFYEKNLGTPGTITLEGGYWDFSNVDAGYVVNQGTVDQGLGIAGPFPGKSFMASASWLSANKVGIGQLQPNVRYQLGDYDGSTNLHVVDVGLGYIIDGFADRWYLNYRHRKGGGPMGMSSPTEDIMQVGFQIMM